MESTARKPAAKRKAILMSLVLAVLLFGLLIPAVLLPYSAAAIEAPTATGCAPGDQACEALMKELQSGKPQAGSKTPGSDEKVSCDIFTQGLGCVIYWVLDIVSDFFINIILSAAAFLFEAMVILALHPIGTITFVKLGFGITLGIANLFFVLILLWIAIATIFDFSKYTARQLLPTLIISALLINFSLAIGSAFINLSNGIAKIFYDRISAPLSATEAQRQGIVGTYIPLAPIASRVMLASKFPVLKDTRPQNPITLAEAGAQIRRDCYERGSVIPGLPIAWCLNSLWDAAWRLTFRIPKDDQDLLTTAMTGVLFKLLITPILIFVLLAGGIFLLVRTISLAFLLILGPLAFLFMILPATQRYYNEWWERLMKWSFFFPAFMFFIFLSIEMGSSFAQVFAQTGSSDRFPALIQYLMMAGLLIGSLFAANQMGIYGASTVTGWGKKMTGAAGKWARGTGKIAAGAAAGAALGSAVGRAIASRRLLRPLARPVEAVAAAGRRTREQREKAALQRRALAAKVSPEYRRDLMRSMAASERADFVRDMKKHEIQQVLGVMTPSQRIALHQEMKQYELDDKVLDATRDLTSAVELETGIERTDARFQEAFNSWLKGATVGDIQKRISAEDIETNTHLHTAIATQGVGELADLRTIAHTREKAEAMRQRFIELGDRQTFELELGLGFSEVEASERAIGRAIHNLQRTNRILANELTAAPPVQINLARARPLGRKAGPPVVVVTTPPPATP